MIEFDIPEEWRSGKTFKSVDGQLFEVWLNKSKRSPTTSLTLFSNTKDELVTVIYYNTPEQAVSTAKALGEGLWVCEEND